MWLVTLQPTRICWRLIRFTGTGTSLFQSMGVILVIKQKSIRVTSARTLEDADFGDCDLVLECTGQFKTVDALKPYLDVGISQVVVSAPIKVPEVLNVVMGVNQDTVFC